MSDLIKKLSLHGMNAKDAMSRFMGDEELFELCFKQFSHDKGFERLENALAAGDYDSAFKAAHSLKGVAGNLGLESLFELLSELVETLRRKEYDADIDGMYQSIVKHSRELFELI